MSRGLLFARALERTGLRAVLRRLGAWRGLLVLNLHRIGDPLAWPGDRDLFSITQAGLDDLVATLVRETEVVHPEHELEAALTARKGRCVALTFDDGWRDNVELALPVLTARGAPAAFFLTTGFIDRPRLAWWDELALAVRTTDRPHLDEEAWPAERLDLSTPVAREKALAALLRRHKSLAADQTNDFRNWVHSRLGVDPPDAELGRRAWMTWDMARTLRDAGMSLGAHTVDHPVLARCTPDEQRFQIQQSVARLTAELDRPVRLFSYPDGGRDSFDATTRAAVTEAGVTHAFSFYGGWQRPGARDRLDIRRVAVAHGQAPEVLRAMVTVPQLLAREVRAVEDAG